MTAHVTIETTTFTLADEPSLVEVVKAIDDAVTNKTTVKLAVTMAPGHNGVLYLNPGLIESFIVDYDGEPQGFHSG